MFYYKQKELGVTQVESPDQMPAEEHWAIIIFETETVHVPGDERSRTAPGHGYPAHTDTHETFKYWAAKDKASLEKALAYMREENDKAVYRENKPYVIIFSRPATIKTTIKVEIT